MINLPHKGNLLHDNLIANWVRIFHYTDWGTCAIDWPLMDAFEDEIAAGKMPGK